MSAAASSDQSIIYTGRKLRTEMRSNEDRMINLSAQSAKSVTLGALNNIDVASLRTTAIPDTAFTMLKLDQAGDDLFKSPQFLKWVHYVTVVAKKKTTTVMLSTLTAGYSDTALIQMLEATRKTPETEKIATRLQRRQVKIWMRSGKTADDIFMVLKLDKKIENLLTNPNLETYVTYMNLFNKYSPGRETTLVNTFVTFYGDEAVAKVIEAAKKVESTEEFAKDLQVALFSQWMWEGAQPKQIWKMLHLEKSTDPNGGDLAWL
ncbi:hypothetical protein F441_15882 [Phytophthora nicotianae CJ01A1]|uniref:RxLR effector PexRD54 WY domain-containing protein n=1 Tax=Phytophthora nicotianae CJ01A1 TaxID=1317063 RepID=W2WBV2_PHYNI|nr:hypothetical protein F441_15882 [Phytophthora nicotianae CJ01A1]